MTISNAEAGREMDSLVKEPYGLVPETPVETEIQKLRQRVAEAPEGARAARPAIGMDLEGRLTMQGIQVGSISMLEVVLDWIDEIVAEGQ